MILFSLFISIKPHSKVVGSLQDFFFSTSKFKKIKKYQGRELLPTLKLSAYLLHTAQRKEMELSLKFHKHRPGHQL